jgi:serine protease Do
MSKQKVQMIWIASVAGLALTIYLSFPPTVACGKQLLASTGQGIPLLAVDQNTLPAEQDIPAGELSTTFRKVAKNVRSTVVTISTTQNGHKVQESGFIVAQDGYILTTNDAVDKAHDIEVKLSDDRKFKSKIVGQDKYTNLAVVKIDTDNLPVTPFGNSDDLKNGDWVIAIGSPFGIEQTVTTGVVTAKGRHLNTSRYSNLIQHGVSINRGSFGSPLFNLSGQVVGINIGIFSESGANQGIGFAVPSNTARSIYQQIMSKGKVTRGYLGVSINEISPEKARVLGLEVTEGALVNEVRPDSPAAKAGLQSNDVIVAFDGKPVRDQHELTNIVAEAPVNKVAEVKFIRDGKLQTAKVEITELKSE